MPRFLGDLRETVVTALPATGSDGSVLYNTTNDVYYTWNGATAAWVAIGSSSATSKSTAFFMG